VALQDILDPLLVNPACMSAAALALPWREESILREPLTHTTKETFTRYARSSLNTIWVGRTNLRAIRRSTRTVVMYIKAMASTE
jgi:hypothetical protein